MQVEDNPKRLLSISAAAAYCRTAHGIERSENSLRKHINKGKLRALKARDGSIRIEQGELDAFERGDPIVPTQSI